MKKCVPEEVVHGKAGVAGDLVETMAAGDDLLDHVLIAEQLVVCSTQPTPVSNGPRHKPTYAYSRAIYLL